MDTKAWVEEGDEEGRERRRRWSKATNLRGGILNTACARLTRTRKGRRVMTQNGWEAQ